jgi:hypothetical protein
MVWERGRLPLPRTGAIRLQMVGCRRNLRLFMSRLLECTGDAGQW